MSTDQEFSSLNLLTSKGMEISFDEIKSKFSLNEEKVLLLKDVISTALEVQRRMNAMCKVMGEAAPTMWIAGGALRDVLLMKKPIIKDIDIFLEFPKDLSDEYLNSEKKRNRILQMLSTFGGAGKSVLIESEVGCGSQVLEVVSHKKEMGEKSQDSYLAHSMVDIIKLKGELLKFDVELILAPTEPDRFIFESFDFSFCKCAIKLPTEDSFGFFNLSGWARVLVDKLKREEAILNAEEKKARLIEKCLTSNWALGLNFLKDVFDKKISFEGMRYTSEQAEYSLREHYERISKKYPEYKVTVSEEFERLYEKKSAFVKSEWVRFRELLKSLQEKQELSQTLAVKSMLQVVGPSLTSELVEGGANSGSSQDSLVIKKDDVQVSEDFGVVKKAKVRL